MTPRPTRRSVLAGAAASAGTRAVPATAAAPRPMLLQGADYVLTMAGLPIPDGDVLIRNGAIVAVGRGLTAPDAQVLNLRGHLVMPGFVDTHWHMWNTAARGLASSRRGGFAPTMAAISPLFSPADAAIGVELALAEAVSAGITTVHDWAHNVRSPTHADAEIMTLVTSGVRARFAYGYPQDAPRDRTMDLAHLRSVGGRQPSALVSLGICTRGPDRSEQAIWRAEWAEARRLGLPISTHMASDKKAATLGGIAALAQAEGLGRDVQLVHLTGASRSAMDIVAKAGSPVSISPWTELAVGYGVPPMDDLIASDLTIGLSVDNMVLAGAADMFAVTRLAVNLERGIALDQAATTDATALRWATAIGAKSLGLGEMVGTLAPGHRADIIAIQLNGPNAVPAGDPVSLVVHAARPADVTLVLIDGVVHKRDARLTRVDLPRLQARAQSSIAAIRKHAGV